MQWGEGVWISTLTIVCSFKSQVTKYFNIFLPPQTPQLSKVAFPFNMPKQSEEQFVFVPPQIPQASFVSKLQGMESHPKHEEFPCWLSNGGLSKYHHKHCICLWYNCRMDFGYH
jgi:hypothetical protein